MHLCRISTCKDSDNSNSSLSSSWWKAFHKLCEIQDLTFMFTIFFVENKSLTRHLKYALIQLRNGFECELKREGNNAVY